MKKLFLALSMLIFGHAQAQDLEPTLLWKITSENNERPSYLYGTIHASCEIVLNEKVMQALQETRQLYLEIKMDDPGLQGKMMQGAMMKDGKTISKLIDAEDVSELSSFLQKEAGFTLQMVDGLKPMLLSSMLLPKMLECPMQSVEGTLMKITKEQSEQVFGLETIEDQLTVFDLIPYDVQAAELVKMSKDGLKESREELNQMIALYNEQNVQGLYEFSLTSGSQMMGDFQDVLLNNRNQNWIPVIDKVSSEVPTFFAVGAAHLAGKEGVINLLRQAGFKVEPVMPQ
uniref:TraB/GumN family protein n=1 Tax=Flavobacterium sp. TaxID=239 RepID=UPI004048F21F